MSLKSALDKLMARQEKLERRFDILFPEAREEECPDRLDELDTHIEEVRESLAELIKAVGMEDRFPLSEYRAGR